MLQVKPTNIDKKKRKKKKEKRRVSPYISKRYLFILIVFHLPAALPWNSFFFSTFFVVLNKVFFLSGIFMFLNCFDIIILKFSF
jgi:hypothetical protein